MSYDPPERLNCSLHGFHYTATLEQANKVFDVVCRSPEHLEAEKIDEMLEATNAPWMTIGQLEAVCHRRAELRPILFDLVKFEVGRVLAFES